MSGLPAGVVITWNDMRSVQKGITAWANEQFPGRTHQQAIYKVVIEEIPEMLVKLREDGREGLPGEMADVFILLMDLATMWDIDLTSAIRDKMQVNFNRTWKKDATSGAWRHTEPGELQPRCVLNDLDTVCEHHPDCPCGDSV